MLRLGTKKVIVSNSLVLPRMDIEASITFLPWRLNILTRDESSIKGSRVWLPDSLLSQAYDSSPPKSFPVQDRSPSPLHQTPSWPFSDPGVQTPPNPPSQLRRSGPEFSCLGTNPLLITEGESGLQPPATWSPRRSDPLLTVWGLRVTPEVEAPARAARNDHRSGRLGRPARSSRPQASGSEIQKYHRVPQALSRQIDAGSWDVSHVNIHSVGTDPTAGDTAGTAFISYVSRRGDVTRRGVVSKSRQWVGRGK